MPFSAASWSFLTQFIQSVWKAPSLSMRSYVWAPKHYRERRRTSTYNTRLNRKETGFSNGYKKIVNIPSTHLFMHLQDTRTMKIKLTLLSVLFLSVIQKLIHLFLIILRNIFLSQ